MLTISAAFVLVASLALLDPTSANINKIDIAPEKIADVIIDQAEQHCQALNSSSGIDSTGGRRRKRDTAESRENIRQTVQQILSDCLASQEPTTPSSTETTTLHPDVANGPCTSALTVNLTGSWRKDRNGSNIRPVNGYYNCDRDLQGNTQWFRFTGDAGRQLADTCSPGYSCGSHGGFWSNATMPSRVGEIGTVRIYGSWSNNCDWYTWPTTYPLTVQRCSSRDGDFVYRAFGTSDCYWSFCGMD